MILASSGDGTVFLRRSHDSSCLLEVFAPNRTFVTVTIPNPFDSIEGSDFFLCALFPFLLRSQSHRTRAAQAWALSMLTRLIAATGAVQPPENPIAWQRLIYKCYQANLIGTGSKSALLTRFK